MTLAGVPQNVIMGISGHKTISVFLRYNIVAPGQLHTAMEAVALMKKNDAKSLDDASTMPVESLEANRRSYLIEKMERETGIEPATSSLGSWRSTAELLPLASNDRPLLCS